ncbi:hypothetical protein [Mucilaginibacter sp.]|uniref:hypothetical protein n=1 Tax=Mucilaginibacter sp. TaxID=1882438 RepID=UPI0025F4E7D5|nr:hypothetical protein [Mucilaginibacter sp.]
MTWLKILIMVLFLFCMLDAGHFRACFILMEGYMILNFIGHNTIDKLVILTIIVTQITGVIAIIKSYDILMIAVSIVLSTAVIVATLLVKYELMIVIWPNVLFLATVATFIIKYIKSKNHIEGNSIVVTE